MRPRDRKPDEGGYHDVLTAVASLVEEARGTAARSINAVMTTTYWKIGRRIVEREQAGVARAAYGEALLQRLSVDLTKRFGRGFSVDRLETARLFYLAYPPLELTTPPVGLPKNSATVSRKSMAKKSATLSRKSTRPSPVAAPSVREFRLSWSHYVLLVRRVDAGLPRSFYETEALRGGWTVRQLERQIDSQFYERTALSRNKTALLQQGAVAKPEDAVTPEQQIKDPFVLEFLGLKDEYSETDLEDALISELFSGAFDLIHPLAPF